MNKFSQYKISTLTGSCCLLLISVMTAQTLLARISQVQDKSTPVIAQVAGTSIGGTVETTPTNALYEQLKLQEQALREQTAAIEAEKQYLENKEKRRSAALYTVMVLLSLLIVINFYLDLRRNKIERERLNPT